MVRFGILLAAGSDCHDLRPSFLLPVVENFGMHDWRMSLLGSTRPEMLEGCPDGIKKGHPGIILAFRHLSTMCKCSGNQREPPQLLSMYSVPGPKGGTPDTEAHFAHRPPHPQRTPAESRLSKAAAPEQGGPVGTPDPDVLASQYGSSSQLPGSQAEPGQATPARLPSLFGTQASQATPARPHRSVLQPAEAPESWPVSWQPEATKQGNAQGLPDQADSQSGNLVSKGIRGRICAASIGSGDVLLYSLTCSEHETNVHAWPPAVRQAGATSDGNNSAVGGIKAVPIMTGRPNVGARHGGTADGQAQPGSVPNRRQSGKKGPQQQSEAPAPVISDAAGFTWRPASMTGTFAQGLARRVCWPLKALDR